MCKMHRPCKNYNLSELLKGVLDNTMAEIKCTNNDLQDLHEWQKCPYTVIKQ
jgi:hypothetical protein